MMCHYDENTELELEPQEDAGRPGDNLSNLRSRLEDLALSRPPNSDEDHGDGLTLPPSPPVDDFNLDEEHSCEATTTSSDEFGSSNRPFPARSVSVPPQGHRTGDNIDSASAKSEPWGGRTFQDRLSSASSVLPSELNNEERQILIPPLDGKGQFGRWPMEKLPVSDSGQFLEGDQWSIGVLLGDGASGQCFIARLITESIKKTATETISQNEEEKDQAVSLDKETDVFCVKKCKYCQVEVNILLEASRNNILQIVTFYGAAIYKRDVCIFMEFMYGSVTFLYKEVYEAPLPEHLYIPFTTDILKAVEFMHGNGFIHNDIKGANVLVDDEWRTAKLTDFGSASSSENKNSSFKDDIWLLGCFILEMMNAERPCCAMLKSGRQQRDFTENIPQGDNQITRVLERWCELTSAVEILQLDIFK